MYPGDMRMSSRNRWARTVGVLYLIFIFAGPLRLMVIPSRLFVKGDAATTTANILAHEGLFRLGIATDVFIAALNVFVVLAIYRLFRDVSRSAALAMLTLGLMDTPLYMFTLANDSAVLLVAHLQPVAAGFNAAQQQALVALFLGLHGQTVAAAEMFWGLWLLPLAVLVWRSGFMPRFIGAWLTLNGIAYVVWSLVALLAPDHESTIASWAFPCQLGELVFMLWLLIAGDWWGRRHNPDRKVF